MFLPAALRRRTPPFAIPLAVILASVALAGCPEAPDVRTDTVAVRMVAQSAAWQASYLVPRPGGGQQEIPTGREIHVPLGAEVIFAITSLDYISDFALPGLGLRDFCAPGLPSEIRFTAGREGRFALRGDQLCGLPHTEKSRGWLVVEDAAAFRTWLSRRGRGAAAG